MPAFKPLDQKRSERFQVCFTPPELEWLRQELSRESTHLISSVSDLIRLRVLKGFDARRPSEPHKHSAPRPSEPKPTKAPKDAQTSKGASRVHKPNPRARRE